MPACITVRVSIGSTVSNVDPNTDFSLVNVATVAFDCSWSVGVMINAWRIPNDINRQWTTALGAIEGDEPSLAAVVAMQIKVALVNNTESGITFPLVENTIPDKSNVTTVCTPPSTLFPVSVVSVCSIFARVSFLTT